MKHTSVCTAKETINKMERQNVRKYLQTMRPTAIDLQNILIARACTNSSCSYIQTVQYEKTTQGTSPLSQWLRLHVPKGGLGLLPDQETGSHVLKLERLIPPVSKILDASTKTQYDQRNNKRVLSHFSQINKQTCRFSRVQLFATPWTMAHQTPLSVGFPRQEFWSGLPNPTPWDLPDSRIKPKSPALKVDSLPLAPSWKPQINKYIYFLNPIKIWSEELWRMKWKPTAVFLPGNFHGQRSLAGYSPWDCVGLDTNE